MIDEQSSASGHDYASNRSAIGAGWTTGGVGVDEVKVSGGGIDITGISPTRSTGELRPVLSGVSVKSWRIGTGVFWSR